MLPTMRIMRNIVIMLNILIIARRELSFIRKKYLIIMNIIISNVTSTHPTIFFEHHQLIHTLPTTLTAIRRIWLILDKFLKTIRIDIFYSFEIVLIIKIVSEKKIVACFIPFAMGKYVHFQIAFCTSSAKQSDLIYLKLMHNFLLPSSPFPI